MKRGHDHTEINKVQKVIKISRKVIKIDQKVMKNDQKAMKIDPQATPPSEAYLGSKSDPYYICSPWSGPSGSTIGFPEFVHLIKIRVPKVPKIRDRYRLKNDKNQCENDENGPKSDDFDRNHDENRLKNDAQKSPW
jgi:hypothetical protein